MCSQAVHVIAFNLAIDQISASPMQQSHQRDKGNLRCIVAIAEHALAEKCAADTDTVQAADQFAVIVAHLDAVRHAALMQGAIGFQHAPIDPCAALSPALSGAGPHHFHETGIH